MIDVEPFRTTLYVMMDDFCKSELSGQNGADALRLCFKEVESVRRGEDGTVWSLRPRDGTPRWTTETAIPGTLPVVLDGDRLYVAGDGVAALDMETGRVLWTHTTVSEVTAPPVPTSTATTVLLTLIPK